MLNQASFYGYVAFDVSLKTTANGREYLSNALNVRRNYKGNDGKYGYDSVPFTIFGPQAKVFADHCRKGNTVILYGSIQSNLEKHQVVEADGAKTKTFNRLSLNVQGFDFVFNGDDRPVNGFDQLDPYSNLPC